MKKIGKIIFTVMAVLSPFAGIAQEKDLVQYVNTRQGTDSRFEMSRGNTYPATGMPFGVHLWSPQTGKNGEDYQEAARNAAIAMRDDLRAVMP